MRAKVRPGSWRHPQGQPEEEGVGAGREGLLLQATDGRGCLGVPHRPFCVVRV